MCKYAFIFCIIIFSNKRKERNTTENLKNLKECVNRYCYFIDGYFELF